MPVGVRHSCPRRDLQGRTTPCGVAMPRSNTWQRNLCRPTASGSGAALPLPLNHPFVQLVAAALPCERGRRTARRRRRDGVIVTPPPRSARGMCPYLRGALLPALRHASPAKQATHAAEAALKCEAIKIQIRHT